MGFIINADLETNQGPTQELYVRVEGFSFNKVTAQLGFQVTYWIDRQHAIKHNRVYLEEEIKPMIGLVQNKILYFEKSGGDGEEIMLTQYIKTKVAEEREVDIPVYVEEEIKDKTVQKCINKELKTVINLKAFGNLYEYCYKKLYDYLITILPEDTIETVR